jgi:hypothetical protein
MPVNADPTQLLLGRGKVYFDRFDSAGNATGLRFVGEADKFEITPSVTVKDYYTMSKAERTKIAQHIDTQMHEVDIQLREFQADNLALALLGDNSVLAQAGGAVVGEQLTAAATPGRIYQTAQRNISAVTAKTGATVLVAGTDYEIVDTKLGLIRAIPGSIHLDGTAPLSVDYTGGVIAGGVQVKAGVESKIEGKLVYIGDPADGPQLDVEVWRVRIQPSGALALITDDYASIPLKGEILDDTKNHPTDPMYHVTYR